jgi:tetrahydromethanopterin S-methyltransferase subunit G
MHEMKGEVIQRILAQESPKSELRLKRYGKKSFRDLFVIFGKWLGLYLEIYLNSRGSVWKFVDCGLILDK